MPPLSIFFPLKFKFVASSPTLGLDEAGRTDKLQISTLFFSVHDGTLFTSSRGWRVSQRPARRHSSSTAVVFTTRQVAAAVKMKKCRDWRGENMVTGSNVCSYFFQ